MQRKGIKKEEALAKRTRERKRERESTDLKPGARGRGKRDFPFNFCQSPQIRKSNMATEFRRKIVGCGVRKEKCYFDVNSCIILTVQLTHWLASKVPHAFFK